MFPFFPPYFPHLFPFLPLPARAAAPRYGSSVELELGQRVSARLAAQLAKELDRRSKEALLGKGAGGWIWEERGWHIPRFFLIGQSGNIDMMSHHRVGSTTTFNMRRIYDNI